MKTKAVMTIHNSPNLLRQGLGFLFFIFLILGTAPAQANGVWGANAINGASSSINGIASSSDGTKLYIANNTWEQTGPILLSTNQGASWNTLTGAGSHAWEGIGSSGDGTMLWAISSGSGYTDDNVYYSMDSGVTWYSPTNTAFNTNTPPLNNVNVPCTANNCWGQNPWINWSNVAVSSNGNTVLLQGQSQSSTYIVTINRATTPPTATWTYVANAGSGALSVSADGTMLVATGTDWPSGNWHTYISNNSGSSWSNSTVCGSSSPLSVAAADNGIVYVACSGGYINKSIDGGVTWTALAYAGIDYWASMSVSADGKHLLARGGSVLYYSDDGGNTWSKTFGGDDGFLSYASSGSVAYYIGNGTANVYLPIPTVTTNNTTAISATGATLNATFVSEDNSVYYPATAEGFIYGTSNPIGSTVSASGSFSPGAFSQNITGLSCGATYFFQPFATNANGTNYGTESYFNTVPCNGADFIMSQPTIPASASTTINLTGINTAWTAGTPGSPVFSVSGISGDSVISQTVTDATHATITVSTNATAGALDVSDGTINPITVSNSATTIVPAVSSQIFYSPGNSYNSGTYIQWEHTAATAKFNFTGTLLNVDLDLTPMLTGGMTTSQMPYLNWQIDGGTWHRAQVTPNNSALTGVLTLATGLSNTTHTVAVYFEQNSNYENSWTPVSAVNITGWEVQSGGSISAPSLEAAIPFTTPGVSPGLRPKRMMIFGDSITRGYDAEATSNNAADLTGAGSTFAQDSWAPLLAKYLDAEAGIVAFSQQGWRSFTVPNNGPAFPYTFNMYDSTHPRTMPSNLDYLVVAQGTNDAYDFGVDVTGYVVSFLIQARAAVGPNTYIFLVPNYTLILAGSVNPSCWSVINEIHNAVADYKNAYPSDNRVFVLDVSGFTAGSQNPATEFGLLGTDGSYSNSATANFHDLLHPNKCGHALLAGNLPAALNAVCDELPNDTQAASGIPSLSAQVIAIVPTQISNVAVNSTGTSATITWTTDRSATSVINYGTSSSYGSTSSNPNLVLSHSITLTGLTQGQVYHYQISSVDTASATVSSGDFTFTAAASSDCGVSCGEVLSTDTSVTLQDAVAVAQYVVGLNPTNFNAANAKVDGNSTITLNDAVLIAKYVVGLISRFPASP